jgi:CSLREA domain-containing protein
MKLRGVPVQHRIAVALAAWVGFGIGLGLWWGSPTKADSAGSWQAQPSWRPSLQPDEALDWWPSFERFFGARRSSASAPLTAAVTSLPCSIVVTTTADENGTNPGACSFREALTAVNNGAPFGGCPAGNVIEFNIGTGTPTINVAGTGLPIIAKPVTILGRTGGATRVELNSAAVSGASGLKLSGGNSLIRSLVINRFTAHGIELLNNGGNVIEDCYIGTDASGNSATGTIGVGIEIFSSSPNNTVGGTEPSQRNVISGLTAPTGLGIAINSSGNKVLGNYIGLNAAGTTALGNIQGINIRSTASNNVIGGVESGARNVISGNVGIGITISGPNTKLQGNYIGTDATGMLDRGNGAFGVIVASSGNILVGGTEPGAGNVISGNNQHGMATSGFNLPSSRIEGNLIGVAADGVTPRGNTQSGVLVGSTDLFIGGSNAGAGNIIAHNGEDGIALTNSGAVRNQFLGNSIFSNAGLGIDLHFNGVTANDAGDGDSGANGIQNFPVLTSATSASGQITIQGTLNSTPNQTFRLEFFANTACDGSGNGEGQRFLGTTSVTTDGSGNVAFTALFTGSLFSGQTVTATATGASGTSEFSACRAATTTCATITLGPSSPLPAGALGLPYNQTLTASGGTAPYTFVVTSGSLPTGLSLSSDGVISGTPTDSCWFTFTVTVADANNCLSSKYYAINISDPPVILSSPGSQSLCTGQSATFSVAATGAGLSYQWRKNRVNISGATGSSYTIASVSMSDAAIYDVVVSGACGLSKISELAILCVSSQLSITSQPISQTVCAGAPATFSVAASGASSITYQWRKNGVNISGANSSSYTIPAVTAGDAGTYDVVVTGACPGVTSNPVSLKVNAPTNISTPLTNQTVCAGSTANFSTTASGTGPLSFVWRKNGTPLNNGGNIAISTAGNTSSLVITNAQATDAATYTVEVADVCGNPATSSATLTLNTPPAIITQPVTQTVCVGAPASFSVTASGIGPLTYQWRKDGVNINGATSSAFNIAATTATDAGSYDVVVSTACGPAMTSNAATLTVNAPPAVVTQPVSLTSCEGQAATFAVSATGTGLSYQWRKNGNNIAGATGSSYTIAAVTANDAGSYDVVVSGTCSPAAISTAATLTVNSPPAITAQPVSLTECEGQSATFSVGATGAGLTYQWRKNGEPIPGATGSSHTIAAVSVSDAGAYDVIVSGTCSPAVTSASATLAVNTPPAITAQPLSLTLCEGQGATFHVTATGTALTYQWRKNGIAIAGATASSYAIEAASASEAGTYDVVVSGACSPPATSAAATLTVNTPTTIASQPSDQMVCPGTAASFTVTASGTGPFTYQWRKHGSNINGANASTYSLPAAAAGDAGSYDVIVTGTCGSATSNAATLTVNAATSIATHPVSQSKIVGQSVTFSVTATGTNLSYQWRKGGTNINGATASSYTINFVALADAGNYDVVVSGTCGNVTSNVAALTVTCPTITVAPATIPLGTVGLPYTPTSFSATGGNSDITFNLTGALPNGMSLVSGQLAGTPTQPGNFPITITATDAYGCSASKDYTLVVNCPTIVISPSTLPTGLLDTVYPAQTFTASAGNAPFTFSLSGTLPAGMSFSGATLSGKPTQPGNFPFTISASDKYGCTQSRGYTLTINRPPVALCQNVTVTAGAACSADASVDNGSYDPDGDSITTAQSPAGPYPVGTTTVTLTVTDSQGATSQCTATVTVNAPTPTVVITNPPSGAIYEVNTPVSFTGTFSDQPGLTHTANWQFVSAGATAGQVGVVNETTGTVQATHSFAAAGVYLVTLTVSNHCGGQGVATTIGADQFTAMVVVYDPGAGFVTGGGWINSPAGALVADPSLTGKANFGFVSKYHQGASVPTGNTEFQFKAGNLNFHSSSYEWLVVAGARAQYKGAGKINGSGDYRFILTAIDGQQPGGGGVDKFRIRIWNNNGGGLVYNNQLNASDSADPTTALGGGNIVIHK